MAQGCSFLQKASKKCCKQWSRLRGCLDVHPMRMPLIYCKISHWGKHPCFKAEKLSLKQVIVWIHAKPQILLSTRSWERARSPVGLCPSLQRAAQQHQPSSQVSGWARPWVSGRGTLSTDGHRDTSGWDFPRSWASSASPGASKSCSSSERSQAAVI